MKKILGFLLVVLTTVSMGVGTACADDTSYGEVNLTLEFPVGLMADAYVTLLNTTTNEESTLFVRAKDGGKLSFMTEFGTYTLVDSKVSTIEGIELDYSVVLNDFSLDESNPNGDWSWDIVGNVRNNKLLGKTTPTPTPATQDSIYTFTIDENNAYFPGMTIPQIQEWYTKEATEFVESGKMDVTLETLQGDVTKWADWVTRKNNSILEPEYRWIMNEYCADKAGDFYEAQKKIYDFLWDYYKETGNGLNFNTWVYEIEIVTPTPNPTPVEVEVITPTDVPVEEIEPTPTEEPTSAPTPTPVEDFVDDRTDESSEDSEETNQNNLIWIFVGALVVALVGGTVFVLVMKNRKNNKG